ncbi:MAG TPA: hypothetical protein VE913_22190 [Longimicrobium sp.]|nr:hypothetical protein [Longimicrobium sp.]
MPEKIEELSEQRADEATEMADEATKEHELASKPPARSEKQRAQKSSHSQLIALLESLLQGKHRVLIDGKAISLSETAQRIAAHGKNFINEFQGVVEDAMRDATQRRETWENPRTSPAMGGFPAEYWVHFEINVDNSLPHVNYPNWIRCKEKSCPENG